MIASIINKIDYFNEKHEDIKFDQSTTQTITTETSSIWCIYVYFNQKFIKIKMKQVQPQESVRQVAMEDRDTFFIEPDPRKRMAAK